MTGDIIFGYFWASHLSMLAAEQEDREIPKTGITGMRLEFP